jgi:hypothetical protein
MPIKKFREWCKDLMELAEPDGYVPSSVFQAKQGIQSDVSTLGTAGAKAKRILVDAFAALTPDEITKIIIKMKTMLDETPRERALKSKLTMALSAYRRALSSSGGADEPIEDTDEEDDDREDSTPAGFDPR